MIITILTIAILLILFCWSIFVYCFEWIDSCNFMVPIRFWIKTIEKYFVLLCLYFFIAIGIIFVFAFALYNYDHDGEIFQSFGNAVRYSIYIFFSVESITIHESLNSIALCETIAREFMVVILLGNFVTKLTVPANPIFFSRFFTEHDGKFSFRYWILLPKGKYLYDAKVRVVITEDSEFIKGINGLEAYWEYEQSFDFIRGVRYVEIDKVPQTVEVEGKIPFRESIEKKNATICIIIKGTSEDGQYYNYMKKYKKEDCVYNCKFVSIQKSEFNSAGHERIVTPIRYQNFNYMTAIDGKQAHINEIYPAASSNNGPQMIVEKKNMVSKLILDSQQIEKGTYWSNFLQDYFSLLLSKIYD